MGPILWTWRQTTTDLRMTMFRTSTTAGHSLQDMYTVSIGTRWISRVGVMWSLYFISGSGKSPCELATTSALASSSHFGNILSNLDQEWTCSIGDSSNTKPVHCRQEAYYSGCLCACGCCLCPWSEICKTSMGPLCATSRPDLHQFTRSPKDQNVVLWPSKH